MQTALYVVATPLGHADDCSPRARAILQDADIVLAEDTRRAGLLLKRLGIERKDQAGFVSFHDHNEENRIPWVLRNLENDQSIAVISDAGTPLISDPGYRLVSSCREQGFPVIPVPGPSAPVAALSAAGLPPLPFTFLGFLPRKKGQAKKLLEVHGTTKSTLVFFERKSRLAETIALSYEALGDRPFCIARELTKDFEEFIRGSLGTSEEMDLDFKGEITVIIGPPDESGETSEDELLAVIAEERQAGGKPKEIARRVADRVRGFTAKAVYEKMQSA